MKKKSKSLNDPHSPELQDFLVAISLTYLSIPNVKITSCNFSTEQLLKFQLYCISVTSNAGKSHSN